MKQRKVNISYQAICRNCHGEGLKDGETCSICLGNGRVIIDKEIKITIKPYIKK